MQLQINRLLPAYFEQSRAESSEVWGKDLLFKKEERVKIVAPSGKGKSSLMNFLYGMRNDYNGSISYDNRPIRDFTPEDFAQLIVYASRAS